MNILKILGKVGSAVVSTMVPGGGAIINMVNEFLPDDKKLPENATGAQAQEAISTLPPVQQAEILAKKYDVEIAEIQSWAAIQDSLSKADQSGASTRPDISMMMAWLVVLQVFTICALMTASIAMRNNELLGTIKDFWPMLLASMGTPIMLLRSYFGMREREKKHRVHAATGIAPIAGVISSLFNRK